MEGTLRERLEALAALEAPAVSRFDSGAAPRGGWAVLPSAFNPPTRAHLRLLDLAEDVDGVEGGAALLTTRNVAKGIEGAALEDRIGMLLATRASRPGLAVLAANQARIVDQAAALRATWPEATFDFVLGHDTLVRLFDQRYYDGSMETELDPFFERHRVIAANRGEVTIEEMGDWVAERAGATQTASWPLPSTRSTEGWPRATRERSSRREGKRRPAGRSRGLHPRAGALRGYVGRRGLGFGEAHGTGEEHDDRGRERDTGGNEERRLVGARGLLDQATRRGPAPLLIWLVKEIMPKTAPKET